MFDFDKGIRPAFGSTAGKKALAETIVSYFPDHKIYVEPFAGGAAVFFKKKPSEIEVLNDKDSEISFAFKFIKAGNFKGLDRFKIEGNREYYERLKSHKPKSDVERFHKFLYLIHFSFGNSRDSFAESTMIGDRKTMSARIEHLPLVTERIKNAKIYNQDFRDIIKAWESKQTFFYFDPPYPDQKGKLKTDLTNEDIYNAVKNIKGKWILSLADSKGGRETFKKFHIKTVTLDRTFNQNTRHSDTELLISNFLLNKTDTWLAKIDNDYEEEEYFDTDFLEKGIRPAFGSPGGKRYLASTIVSYIPDHNKYVEPFAGGAAVFFAKKQSEAEILNDKDPEIAFAYKFLRDTDENKIDKLKEQNWKPSNNLFDTLKSKQIKSDDEIERFHKHIYLQQWSTGGMKDHFSDGGEWNYSEYPKSITRWQIYKERLEDVKIYNRDFQEIIKEHDSKDTFFYLDPPYPKHWPGKDFGFNPDSLKEILKNMKGKFILSYPIEAKDDFKEFNIKIVETEKHIIGRPKEMRKEILVSNYPLEKSDVWLQKDYLDKGIRQAFGSPGGKKYLAHIIASYIPEHKTYIESFAGGAAVFFAKKPSDVEVLNDYDFQIANAYKTIKEEDPDMVRRAANLKDWTSRIEGLRMAWRNRSPGIKGLLNYFYGLRGSFSSNRYSFKRSSIGRSLKPSFSNLEKLKERMKNTKVLNQDYKSTFKYDSKDTFYYLDPPYPGEWPREDIHEKFDLKEFIDCIKNLKGKFIISINKENKKYLKNMGLHFKEVERITTFTRPDQQEDPNHRSYDIELLVSNFPLHKTDTWLAKSDSFKQIIDITGDAGLLEENQLMKEDDPYIYNPPEDADYDYVVQHHWRGRSCHSDLRAEINGYLIGWTILDSMPDKVVDPVMTLKDAQEQDSKDIFKINWNTGEFKIREIGNEVKRKTEIMCAPKSKGPRVWLDVEGVAKPGEVGSTSKFPGVFHIIDKGKIEFGAQKPWAHEYYLEGKVLKGKLVFRLLNRREVDKVIKRYFEDGYTREEINKMLLYQKLMESIIEDSFLFKISKDELKQREQLSDAIEILIEGEKFRKQVCPGGSMINYILDPEQSRAINVSYLRKILSTAFRDDIGMLTHIRKVLPQAESSERTISPFFWVVIQVEDQTPYVLTKEAEEKEWLPPAGVSALPKKIRENVPERLRYWTMKDKTKALEARKELRESEGLGIEKTREGKIVLPLEKQVPIVKLDEEKQIAYGIVLEPDTVDAQGDIISTKEIEKACYWFMEHNQKFREMHGGDKIDARVVENYLAPQDLTFKLNGKTEKVKKGSWIIGVKIYDSDTWQKCKTGEYTGFSIGGYGLRREVSA